MTIGEELVLRRHYKFGPDEGLWPEGTAAAGNPMQLLVGWRQSQGGFSMIKASQKDPIDKHVHTYEDEAVYVLGGSATVYMGEEGEQVYELAAGDFLYQPRGVPHAWTVHETVSFINIQTPGGVMDNLLDELLGKIRSGEPVSEKEFGVMYTNYGIRLLGKDDKWIPRENFE